MSEKACGENWHVWIGAAKPGDKCQCGEQTFTSWEELYGE